MKKTISSLFILTTVSIISCTTPPTDDGLPKQTDSPAAKTDSIISKADTVAATPTVEFTFKKAGDESFPKSGVSIVVNGKETFIKEISGVAEQYQATDFSKYQIPKNALTACGAWSGGQGSYFYVVANGPDVDVYEGWQDEQVSIKEGFHWEKIKSIR